MEVTVGENLLTGVSVRTSKHSINHIKGLIHHIKALYTPHEKNHIIYKPHQRNYIKAFHTPHPSIPYILQYFTKVFPSQTGTAVFLEALPKPEPLRLDVLVS